MTADAVPAFELWPTDHRQLAGEWVFVPDGTGGGVVVGRVWQGATTPSWIGRTAHGCGDRQHRVRGTRQAAAEAVIEAWQAAGQPDARRAAEAAAEAAS